MSTRFLSRALAAVVLAAALCISGSSALAVGPGVPQGPPVIPPPAPKQDKAKVAAAAANAIAPATSDSTFVPITPCRIVDTRAGTGSNGTKFGSGTTRSLRVTGTSGFPAQGGKANGCGIPDAAKAVSINAVLVSPSKAGGLRIWPAGQAEPTANFLNYGNFTMSGSGIVAVTASAAGSNITVKNYSSSTNLVLDISGYYLPEIAGMIAPVANGAGSVYAGTGIVSVSNPSAGIYYVTVDRDVSYCTPMVNTYNAGSGVYGAAYAFNGAQVVVFTWYLSSTTHAEVAYSFYAYLTVDC